MRIRVACIAAFLTAAALDARADAVLFSNGPLINLPFGGSGGAHASRVQGELGLSLLSFGGGGASDFDSNASTVVDDFVVPGPLSWRITRVTVFALDAPFGPTATTLTLWNGAPWAAGSVVATSPPSATLPTQPIGGYRVPSASPSSITSPFRPIVFVVDWVLAPGHYWLGWRTGFTFISPHSGIQNSVPPVTVSGQAATGDGRWMTEVCHELPPCEAPVWHDAVDGGFAQGFPFVIQGRPVAPRKGDMGGTAGPDLLFRNVNAASPDFNKYKLWLMNGVLRESEAYVTPDMAAPSWTIAGSDDFDTGGAPWNWPDGRTDLLLRNEATGGVEFWLMNGADRVGAPVPLTGVVTPDILWKAAATADFDADGRPDIVWRHTVTQQLVVWTMSGAAYRASILPTPDHAVDANWTLIGAQDYNDDGATDFLWYNESSGRVVTWYLNAALVRTSGQFVTPPQAGDNNWRVVASGDYSRAAPVATPPTGSADIVWRNATSGRTVVWHLDFASTRTLGEFTSPMSNTPALDWVVVGPK